MVEQPVDRVVRPVHEVDDAGRDLADRVDRLEDQPRGARVGLRGLEDESVAAGDRVGEEPERDHRREVEGGDRGDHPDRLTHRFDVDAGRHPLEVLALQQVRHRRRRLDRLQAAPDLAVGVGQRLAHVGGDQGDQLLAPSQELLAQRQHRAGPTLRRNLAPARLCRSRRRHGRVDLNRSGERHLRHRLPGRRVDVRNRLNPRHRPPLPTHVVPQPLRLLRPMGLWADHCSAFSPVGHQFAGIGSGRTAAIRSARRCCQSTSTTAIVSRAKSIVASTLTWTGIPRSATPNT